DGDVADGEEVIEAKVEADAEHQQDDADLGELLGDAEVADETGRVRADGDAGEEVTDDGGEAEFLGGDAEDPGGGEGGGDGGDEGEVVCGRRGHWHGRRGSLIIGRANARRMTRVGIERLRFTL